MLEVILLMAYGGTCEDLLRTCAAHESVWELARELRLTSLRFDSSDFLTFAPGDIFCMTLLFTDRSLQQPDQREARFLLLEVVLCPLTVRSILLLLPRLRRSE